MTAKQFQGVAKRHLSRHFGELVVLEWPISRGATDVFAPDDTQYSPRIDIAVNTIGTAPGNHAREIAAFLDRRAPPRLMALLNRLSTNANPRCSLAIEVVFSGSSKHILGDITNASMMGLYGLVVVKDEERILEKAKRIFEYVKRIIEVGKAPANLFQNTRILSASEFLHLFED